jgi:endonuclease/exonuclease/phosphatase family metal-dependent hydrolase
MMRRLRVVTWNVGRLYSPTHNNRLDTRDIPQVANTLHELDADAALLQELVDGEQLRALAARLPAYTGVLAERCGYDRHVAVLVREALAPAFEQHQLEPSGRGIVVATFDVNGARASALPVHFDVFDSDRRRAQAEAVAALAEARPEPLVVVGGDLNLDPAWAAGIGDHVDGGTWRLLTERFVDGGHQAGPTLLGLLRVDHVLARGPLMRRLAVRVSPGRRLPMGDHDPVVCDVDLAG